jgi:hypothetical protein
MKSSYTAYSRKWDPAYLKQALAILVVDGTVDFGILDEKFQRKVIRHLVANSGDRKRLPTFDFYFDPALIEHNCRIVRERYSLEAYGRRLLGIYRQLAATQPGEVSAANADDLLDEFLRPGRFNLLRT